MSANTEALLQRLEAERRVNQETYDAEYDGEDVDYFLLDLIRGYENSIKIVRETVGR